MLIRVAGLLLLLFAFSQISIAGTVLLQWDHSVSEHVVVYRMYLGQSSRNYLFTVWTGHVETLTTPKLPDGFWFFSVTAIDKSGNESDFSNEVSKEISGGDPGLPTSQAPRIQGLKFGTISLLDQ
jgi:fibronectin type 3 domain-containing protein